MAGGDRAAGDEQFQRHGPPDVVADADDRRARTPYGPVGPRQQRGDATRRARPQSELAQGQMAHVFRVEAVDILRGSMRWISAVGSRRSGNGSCTRMPWTSGSALSASISARSSASLVSAGRSWSMRGCRPSRPRAACCGHTHWRPDHCRRARRPGPAATCPPRAARRRAASSVEQFLGNTLAVEDAGGCGRVRRGGHARAGAALESGRALSPNRLSPARTPP